MKSGSFEFIQSTLTVLAVVASVAAFLFVIFEFGEARGRRPLHQWLTGGWRLVTGSGWSGLAETISRAYVNTLNGIIRDYFEDADKGTVLSVLFVGLVFVLIPAAALLNLAIGGSTFLAKYYLSLLAVLVVFNFTGESRRLAVVNGAAAVYLGLRYFFSYRCTYSGPSPPSPASTSSPTPCPRASSSRPSATWSPTGRNLSSTASCSDGSRDRRQAPR